MQMAQDFLVEVGFHVCQEDFEADTAGTADSVAGASESPAAVAVVVGVAVAAAAVDIAVAAGAAVVGAAADIVAAGDAVVAGAAAAVDAAAVAAVVDQHWLGSLAAGREGPSVHALPALAPSLG